jgi:hypothetical protein
MSGGRLLVATLSAVALGALGGWFARGRPARGPGRPDAVESVLRAVDADDRRALATALEAAGPAAQWPSPWKDEVALGAVVASGDLDAVLAFGTSSPNAPARARALLYVRAKARDAALRDRAQAALAERYPQSWALRTGPGAPR